MPTKQTRTGFITKTNPGLHPDGHVADEDPATPTSKDGSPSQRTTFVVNPDRLATSAKNDRQASANKDRTRCKASDETSLDIWWIAHTDRPDACRCKVRSVAAVVTMALVDNYPRYERSCGRSGDGEPEPTTTPPDLDNTADRRANQTPLLADFALFLDGRCVPLAPMPRVDEDKAGPHAALAVNNLVDARRPNEHTDLTGTPTIDSHGQRTADERAFDDSRNADRPKKDSAEITNDGLAKNNKTTHQTRPPVKEPQDQETRRSRRASKTPLSLDLDRADLALTACSSVTKHRTWDVVLVRQPDPRRRHPYANGQLRHHFRVSAKTNHV